MLRNAQISYRYPLYHHSHTTACAWKEEVNVEKTKLQLEVSRHFTLTMSKTNSYEELLDRLPKEALETVTIFF